MIPNNRVMNKNRNKVVVSNKRMNLNQITHRNRKINDHIIHQSSHLYLLFAFSNRKIQNCTLGVTCNLFYCLLYLYYIIGIEYYRHGMG
jgi:hypothetical protein